MNMNQDEIKRLTTGFLEATLSHAEELRLREALRAEEQLTDEETAVLALLELDFPDDAAGIMAGAGLDGQHRASSVRPPARRRWLWTASAAAVLAVAFTITAALLFRHDSEPQTGGQQTDTRQHVQVQLTESTPVSRPAEQPAEQPAAFRSHNRRQPSRTASVRVHRAEDGDAGRSDSQTFITDSAILVGRRMATVEVARMEAAVNEALRQVNAAVGQSYILMLQGVYGTETADVPVY